MGRRVSDGARLVRPLTKTRGKETKILVIPGLWPDFGLSAFTISCLGRC